MPKTIKQLANGPITHHDDNIESPPRVAINITADRVQYNQDTIEYIVKTELDRLAGLKIKVNKSEIAAFRTNVARELLINYNPERALNLKLK